MIRLPLFNFRCMYSPILKHPSYGVHRFRGQWRLCFSKLKSQSKRSISGKPLKVLESEKPVRHNDHHYWAELLWTHARPLTYPFKAYGRAQSRRPYVVQVTSSLIIYFLGDLSAQYIQRPIAFPVDSQTGSPTESNPGVPFFAEHYAVDRSLRALLIGSISSIPSYHWFLFLSRNLNISPSRTRFAFPLSLLTKIVINQIIFTPAFNSYFFGMQSLLTTLMTSGFSLRKLNKGLKESWTRIKHAVPISWWNSCKFWPVVTAFSFTFVPPQSRSVFAGVVAIGWQSYLGILNQRMVVREASMVK